MFRSFAVTSNALRCFYKKDQSPPVMNTSVCIRSLSWSCLSEQKSTREWRNCAELRDGVVLRHRSGEHYKHISAASSVPMSHSGLRDYLPTEEVVLSLSRLFAGLFGSKISQKLGGRMRYGPRKNQLNVVVDPDCGADPGTLLSLSLNMVRCFSRFFTDFSGNNSLILMKIIRHI